MSRPSTPSKGRKKLPVRFAPIVFAFYMAVLMGLVMCSCVVALNSGIGPGYWPRVLRAYVLAVPVAFASVLLIRPIAMRLSALTVQSAPR